MKTLLDKIQPLCIAIALLLLCSLQGGVFYYKVQPVKPVTPDDIKTFDIQNKYIILHQRDKAWQLSQPLISDSTLKGKLSVLPENRYKFLTTKPKGGNRHIRNKAPYESYVPEEVHLYVSDSVVPENYEIGGVKIALSKISNEEVYVKAKGRTSASWLIPAIAGSVLADGAIGGNVLVASLSHMHIKIW